MVVNEVELTLSDLPTPVLRTGTLRGTVSEADAGTRAVELSFSACVQPVQVCLR